MIVMVHTNRYQHHFLHPDMWKVLLNLCLILGFSLRVVGWCSVYILYIYTLVDVVEGGKEIII